MPSFGDSIFLFVLALILFGPKKLPELARQLGKLMAEFRRASNEFRIQMEDELRVADQAERQKQIAAIEAAAPAPAIMASVDAGAANTIAPPVAAESVAESAAQSQPVSSLQGEAGAAMYTATAPESNLLPLEANDPAITERPDRHTASPAADPVSSPVPIAVSGSLRILPPATGLPTGSSSLTALINSVPHAVPPAEPQPGTQAPEPHIAAAPAEAVPALPPAREEALHG